MTRLLLESFPKEDAVSFALINSHILQVALGIRIIGRVQRESFHSVFPTLPSVVSDRFLHFTLPALVYSRPHSDRISVVEVQLS